MKKLRSCFLFQTVSVKRPLLFWLWNGFFLLLFACLLSLCSLRLAYGQYGESFFAGYFSDGRLLGLNTLPILFLLLLVWLLTGRAWIAWLVTALPVFLASAGNYFKLLFRDDPFLFADMDAIFMALRLTGGGDKYTVTPDAPVLLGLGLVVVGALFLFFFVRGRIRLRWRALGLIPLLLCFLPLWGWILDTRLYNLTAPELDAENKWSATQKYISHGFVYPFLHSIRDAFPPAPTGYSDAAALEILGRYEEEDIPEEKKVNVIAVQLEAFSDLSLLGIEGIDPEVYAAYHKLEAESYTGNLLTNIFAGGTVDTERCFVTGYPTVDNFRHDTGSYVRYFNDQGYYTEGSHSCYNWFYNRLNINRYLGFQRYYFLEDRYGEMVGGKVAYDDVLIPDILHLFQEREEPDKPYFSFSVTYQGHGPYSSTGLNWGAPLWNGDHDEESTYYILNNYLSSVQDTGWWVDYLAKKLNKESAPVVLVLFGDHKPWLGDHNSAWEDLGVNLDVSTPEGYYNYYATRYLIWANDAAKAVLGKEFQGEGPDVSPCFLMNLVFEQCGFGKGSRYMQAAEQVYERSPVVSSTGAFVEDGVLTWEPSPALEDALAELRIAEYYRKRHPEID